MSDHLAPRTTAEAAEFLRKAHVGPLQWRAKCLMLQRLARGLPAVFPSALAAQLATPEEDRVHKVSELRRGMVAYSDDKFDSNPFGHIYFIIGRTDDGEILTWTNDARRSGGVDVVPITFFQDSWGDEFQFGATSLNGFDLPEFEAPKPKPDRVSLGDNYRHAIEDVRRARNYHRQKGHDRLVELLDRDLVRMKRRVANWK